MASYLNITRGLATGASSHLVRAPIAFFGVDGRYTNALYSAAAKTKKVDKVEQDLAVLANVYQKDHKFREYLINPLVKASEKKEVLTQLLTNKLKVCDITSNLIGLMAENNRLKYFPQVAANFAKIMAVSRGELECIIITAKPLDDPKLKQELDATLKKFTTKKLTIITKVDPTIIGGVVIDFGGEHYIDMSLRSKLKTYTEVLRETI